jgi:hypothetical protein
MKPPVDRQWVRASEEVLGLVFPDAYCSSIMNANGGYLVLRGQETVELFPIRDGTTKESLRRTASNVVTETERKRKFRAWRREAIAIGSTGDGDVVALIASEGDRLFLWDHETHRMRPLPFNIEEAWMGYSENGID